MSQKPISDRQLAANRANARKSTGPRTAAGKARCRMNALKHGLFASRLVLPTDSPESVAQLPSLRRRLLAQIPCAGPVERSLVKTIAVCWLRLTNAYRAEARLLQRADGGDAPGPVSTDDDFHRLLRHEARIERLLDRCLDAEGQSPFSDTAPPD